MQSLVFNLVSTWDFTLNRGMKNFPLNLDDLVPREVTFYLSDNPTRPVTLCKWSLRVRAWATSTYTSKGLEEIFSKQKIEEIAEMAFFMVKDKTLFETKDAFFDSIVTVRDQINVIKALLTTVGIGEPEIEKITKAVEAQEQKDVPDPKTKTKRKTGDQPSTL